MMLRNMGVCWRNKQDLEINLLHELVAQLLVARMNVRPSLKWHVCWSGLHLQLMLGAQWEAKDR